MYFDFNLSKGKNDVLFLRRQSYFKAHLFSGIYLIQENDIEVLIGLRRYNILLARYISIETAILS